jgi:nitrile hydratase accessory protein
VLLVSVSYGEPALCPLRKLRKRADEGIIRSPLADTLHDDLAHVPGAVSATSSTFRPDFTEPAMQADRVDTLPQLPREKDGPVFAEPRQAQAFALAVKLSEQGHFSWKEWAETLGEELRSASNRGEPDDGSHYYEHWLAALERLASRGDRYAQTLLHIQVGHRARMARLCPKELLSPPKCPHLVEGDIRAQDTGSVFDALRTPSVRRSGTKSAVAQDATKRAVR